MQKIILLICAILMTSTIANACAGITITGKSGKPYCMSKFTMNWYTAYAWCKEQNMNLIDLNTTCKTYNGTCSELVLSTDEQNKIKENGATVDWAWTNTSTTSSQAYVVNLSSSSISSNGRSGSRYYAVCY